MTSENICKCGHDESFHLQLDFTLGNCYFINEYHEHCPCKKFHPKNQSPQTKQGSKISSAVLTKVRGKVRVSPDKIADTNIQRCRHGNKARPICTNCEEKNIQSQETNEAENISSVGLRPNTQTLNIIEVPKLGKVVLYDDFCRICLQLSKAERSRILEIIDKRSFRRSEELKKEIMQDD